MEDQKQNIKRINKDTQVTPGVGNTIFQVTLDEAWCPEPYNEEFLVKATEDPHKKPWKVFLERLTLGLYEAPWEYTVELIKK